MLACRTASRGMVEDMTTCRLLQGDILPVDGCDATCDVSPRRQLCSPLPQQSEFDDHLCACPGFMVLELGWQPDSDCKSKNLQKFDVLYSMTPFDVALPDSQQSRILDCLGFAESTVCDSLGEVSANLASMLNDHGIAEGFARAPVVEVPVDAQKSYEGPLSWQQILLSLTTLTNGHFGLCLPWAPCPHPAELASAVRVPIKARCQTTQRTSRSWWTRTVPALQADAQHGGDPSDLIVDMDLAGASESARTSERGILQYEVSEALSAARCSVSSLKGNKHMPNQDRAVCASLGMGEVQVLGVWDGHGDTGHVVADVSSEILPKLLLQALAKSGTSFPSVGDADGKACWLEATADAFVDLQGFFEGAASLANDSQGVTNSKAIDATESGTTATVVLLFPEQRALVAHVGDSRAILATRPRGKWSVSWSVSELTHDHKPDLPAERARIERAGAQVGTPNAYDPTPRVFTPGQTWPYIAMSRCLGDLHAHTQGVSAMPEASLFGKLYDPSTEEAVLIICSDGVWDVMDAATVVEFAMVSRGMSQEPASAIACEAYARWSDLGYEEDYVDDITVVVKFL